MEFSYKTWQTIYWQGGLASIETQTPDITGQVGPSWQIHPGLVPLEKARSFGLLSTEAPII
jgi:hypothetical protein